MIRFEEFTGVSLVDKKANSSMHWKMGTGQGSMKIDTISYLNEVGVLSPTCKHEIPDTSLLKMYRAMQTTRHIDERAITLQRQGSITFAMSALGEEACSVAGAAGLEEGDWIFSQYREAGILFWRDYPVQDYWHQMFCNAKDVNLGRQMPNHYASPERNIVTVSSPLGTQIPHAAGTAYAMKMRGDQKVAMCYFGDGTTSEGDFHTGVNFAAVRKAPCIFFRRNNGYAISTGLERQFASDGIAPKGIGYGIHTFRIDGNDVFAVRETVARARKICLDGEGPVLIEAMTYRRGAHSTSDDPSLYRPEGEDELWEKRCPVLRLGEYLKKQKLWSDAKDKKLLKEIQEEVTKAIEVAKATPKPPLHTLMEDVYFEIPSALQEQYEELKRLYPGRD